MSAALLRLSIQRTAELYDGQAAMLAQANDEMQHAAGLFEQVLIGTEFGREVRGKIVEAFALLEKIADQHNAVSEWLGRYALDVFDEEVQIGRFEMHGHSPGYALLGVQQQAGKMPLPLGGGEPATGQSVEKHNAEAGAEDRPEPYVNNNEKTKQASAMPGGFDEVNGRLDDLLKGARRGDQTDVVAAIAAASVLSDNPLEGRGKFAKTVKNDQVEGIGSATLLCHLDSLGDTKGETPLDLLVLGADVINRNGTSVLPRSTKTNAGAINSVVAAVRDRVENHYGITTNDEGAVGFMAECLLREKLGSVSPEMQAGLDARLREAWGRISPMELHNKPELRRLYHAILGVEN